MLCAGYGNGRAIHELPYRHVFMVTAAVGHDPCGVLGMEYMTRSEEWCL